MSKVHDQMLIHAPTEKIWELVGNPARHPEWWPRVVEVRGERYDPGDQYVQVTKEPLGSMRTVMEVESLEDLRAINLRCTTTGTFARWLLTEAQGDTFVDVEIGMDPVRTRDRILDKTVAKPYFRRWLAESLKGLEEASTASTAQPSANL
jgi:uncharacterized protein YndB with AHSA1/START domain